MSCQVPDNARLLCVEWLYMRSTDLSAWDRSVTWVWGAPGFYPLTSWGQHTNWGPLFHCQSIASSRGHINAYINDDCNDDDANNSDDYVDKHKVLTWTVAVADEYQVKEKSERPSKSRYATLRFSRHMSVFKRRRHLSIGGLHLKPVSSTCLRTFRTKAVVWRYFQILSFIRILGAELSKIW